MRLLTGDPLPRICYRSVFETVYRYGFGKYTRAVYLHPKRLLRVFLSDGTLEITLEIKVVAA